MKRMVFLTGMLMLVVVGYVFAADIETDSRIAQVTVYPDSALLTRAASLKLSAGEYKIIFSNIIPELDENSLRISAQGASEVKLFGAQVKREQLEEVPAEKVKELKDQIQKMEDQARQVQNNKSLLQD